MWPSTDQLLRYAILRHEGCGPAHFDVLVERQAGGDLAAWRTEAWPIAQPTSLQRLTDHRRVYLDYQGPISGGRGHVTRVEAGVCRVEAVGECQWVLCLQEGTRRLRLTCLRDDQWVARAE